MGPLQTPPEADYERQEGTETALQASRRSDSERLTHEQSEIERAAVKKEPLEDVLVAAQMSPSHVSRSIEVGEWPLDAFAPQALHELSSFATVAAAIGIHRAPRVEVALPLPLSAIGLGNVALYQNV